MLTARNEPGDPDRAAVCFTAARLMGPVRSQLIRYLRTAATSPRSGPSSRPLDGRHRGQATPDLPSPKTRTGPSTTQPSHLIAGQAPTAQAGPSSSWYQECPPEDNGLGWMVGGRRCRRVYPPRVGRPSGGHHPQKESPWAPSPRTKSRSGHGSRHARPPQTPLTVPLLLPDAAGPSLRRSSCPSRPRR